MATSMKMSETDSSDSDDDSTDDSSGSEDTELYLSSWAYIHRSLKEVVGSGNSLPIDPRPVYHSAIQALVHGDPFSALKLFSLGLSEQLRAVLIIKEHTLSEGNNDHPRLSPIISVKIVCHAMNLCIDFRDKLTVSTKTLRRSLQGVVDNTVHCCDMLALTDVSLLSSAAGLYFSLDETQKALHVAGRAVEINPDSISTHETFENLCCNLVERWHFVMLNDKVRNCAYQQAIQAVLRETPKQATVCDVGCGTGLLSLIAAEQPNCSQVFAIEKSTVMCTITRDVLTANQESAQAEKIRVINKMSSRMSVPADMSDKVDILVTETFDGGLFGEGILPTLCHAWSNLLKNSDKEKGQVIPGKAELYMQGIESDFILRENRWIGRFRDLDTSDLHMYSTVGMCDRDPYTCNDLKYLPGGYKTLTKPVKFMDVDFNDPEGLLLLKKGYVQKATLDAVTRGRVDALVMWFSLHLDSSTHISTHTDTNCCWEQAVFPVCPLKLVEQQHPNGSDATLNVEEGDTVHIAQRVKGGRLCMAVTDISRHGRSEGKCSSDVAESSVPLFLSDYKEWCRHKVYCLAGWEVITLNNTALQEALHEELRELFKLSRKRNENTKTHFIHLNDAFSPLCLQALNLGYHHVATVTVHPVHKTLLWKMATDNNIDIGRITAVGDAMEFRRWTLENMGGSRSAETVDQPGNVTSETSAGFHGPCASSEGLEATESEQMPASHTAESSTSSRTRPWSVTGLPRQINAVVLCDFVDYQGRIVEGLSNHLKAMRRCLSQYSSKTIYPSSVDVYGVLIDSEQLQRLSRLESDDNTLGFKIAAFINKFATRNHQGITFTSLPHKKLSKPFKMFSIDLSELAEAPGFFCNSHGAAKHPEKTLSNDSKLGTAKTHSSSYTEEFEDELPSDHSHTAVKETIDSGQKEHKHELSNTVAEQNQVSDKCDERKSSSEIHDKTKVFVSELRESGTSDSLTQTSHLLEKPLYPVHDHHDSTTKQTLLDTGECAPSTSSKTENNTASQKGPFFSPTTTQEEALVNARTQIFSTNSPTVMSSSQPYLPHEHSAHHHHQQLTRLPTVDGFSAVPCQSLNEKETFISENSSHCLTSGDNTLCKSSQTTRTSHISALTSSGDHSSSTSSGDHSSSTSSGDHSSATSSGDHSSATSSGDHSSSTSSGDHSSLPHPAAQNQDMKPPVTTTTDSSCIKSNLTVAESSTNSSLDSDSSRGEIDKSSMKRNLRADNLIESEAGCSGIKRKRLSKEKEERGGGSADADVPESALEDDELEDSDPLEMKQTVHVKVPIVHSGNLTALVYWFDLHLSPSHSISTLDPNHHWQQAAVMTHVSQRRHITQGDVLNLCLQLCNSAISFMIKDEN